MRLKSKVLGLPASLVLFIALHSSLTSADEQESAQWLTDRSAHPGPFLQEPRGNAGSKAQAVLRRSPVGVLKMSDDPGEKFFPEYWLFDEDFGQSPTVSEELLGLPLRARSEDDEVKLLSNSSAAISYKPPFALHMSDELAYPDLRNRDRLAKHGAIAALAALEKRDFTCPTGTSDCSSINAPNACCTIGETCFNITDTGLGSVGCCPNGVSCGGTISNCDSANTPCASGVSGSDSYVHGGCCIPNYICAGVGCVINPALVVTVVVTQTFIASSSQTSVQTSTLLSTITPSTSTVTDTALQTSLTCSSDMHACPVNLGGGCCTSGYTCAASSSCIPPSGFTFPSASTTSADGVAPVRPTTDSSTSTSISLDTGSCPTGFYACSAYYRGGCCRTGRDCQTTSCPPTSSTTIVSGTVTIVVPVGSAATVLAPSGECATGWSTCAASVGGNCCPNGWQCGTASCSSISPTQTSLEQKKSPNLGARVEGMRGSIWVLSGILVIVLV